MRFSRSAVLEWMYTIGLAIVITAVLRTFVIEAKWVPSESMRPTIEIGDRVLVERLFHSATYFKRGDIVVFDAPPKSGLGEVLIKRVIGLPGEQISVRLGKVYVNGTLLPDYVASYPTLLTSGTGKDIESFNVPEKSLFVMGDNRGGSFDSRYWGEVPESLIIGKAFVRYYPLSRIGMLASRP